MLHCQQQASITYILPFFTHFLPSKSFILITKQSDMLVVRDIMWSKPGVGPSTGM
jgi:hypothetical protein